MPKLLITQDCEGSPDGITIATFKAGETVDITPHLAPILIAAGWAKPANEAEAPKVAPAPDQETAPVIHTPETKAAPAAPENKAHTPKAETKGGKGKGK